MCFWPPSASFWAHFWPFRRPGAKSILQKDIYLIVFISYQYSNMIEGKSFRTDQPNIKKKVSSWPPYYYLYFTTSWFLNLGRIILHPLRSFLLHRDTEKWLFHVKIHWLEHKKTITGMIREKKHFEHPYSPLLLKYKNSSLINMLSSLKHKHLSLIDILNSLKRKICHWSIFYIRCIFATNGQP